MFEDTIELMDKFFPWSSHRQNDIRKQKTKGIVSRKRILVVDDSIQVREVECRLLQNKGYLVDSAVNGIDAWNAVRVESYDTLLQM